MRGLLTHTLAILTTAFAFGSSIVQAQLGSADKDLVFVPTNGCRIVDTRVAGGALVAGTNRDLDVTSVASYASQGGEASDCNGLGGAGSFAAVAITFTIINPNVSGTFKAWPFSATEPPNAVAMAFAAGEVRSNFQIIKLDQGAPTFEMTVKSSAAAHLTADVVGYFVRSPATALECVEKLSTGNTISAGSFGTQSTASCDPGYTITGGGCSMSNFDGRVVTTRTIVSGSSQTHFCAFRNEGTSTVDGLAYARCCRVPGRP